MENDYSQLEHLIQDVTNIDTARMTLRWALERLNVLERANHELDEKLIASLESQKSAEKKRQEMEEMVASRTKLWSEQEAFYKKLEQTVNLLAEGKVDIPQIARKEVELDRVRQEISEQYKNQLQELERANREMVARWTERLLQAESFNPDTLSEVIKKYDDFRRSVDRQYQDRLLQLEKSIHEQEGKLSKREVELEGSYQSKLREIETLRVELQAGLERRVKELDATHDALRQEVQKELEDKKGRLVAESEALKDALHRDFQSRTENFQKEQTRREEDILRAWDAQRQQLTEESKDLARRLRAATQQIGELEQILATSDAKHQEDLLRYIAEAEYSFQQKVKELEKIQSNNRLAVEERARQMEEEFSARRADLEKFYRNRIAVGEEQLGRERKTLELDKKLMLGELARADERFKQAQLDIFAVRQAMERQKSELEAQAEEKLTGFAKVSDDKLAAAEARRLEHLKEAENAWQQEKQRIFKDLAARDSALAKAHADLLALREKMAQEMEDKLKDQEKDESAKRAALEAGWQVERQWFFKELESRDGALGQLKEQLNVSHERLTESAVRAQQSLESLRDELHRQFDQVAKTREAQTQAREQVLQTRWEEERRKLLQEIKAAEANGVLNLQVFNDKWELDRRRLLADAESAQAQAEARFKAHEARWSAERQDLQDQIKAAAAQGEARLKSREIDWEKQRQELLSEIQSAKDQGDSKVKTLESQWSGERQQLLDEIRKAQAEGEAKLKALEVREDNERRRLLDELGERDGALEKLKEELKNAQNTMVEASTQAQLASDALRTELTREFQEVLGARGKEEEERRAALESSWKSEKLRLLEEVSRVEDQFKKAQDEILALRESMDKQRKSLEAEQYRLKESLETSGKEALLSSQAHYQAQMKFSQEEWIKEKQMFVRELEMRDVSLRDLAQQLHDTREKMAQAAVGANKNLDALKVHLEREVQDILKSREAQEESRRKAMESSWRAERERLLQEMLLKETELQRAQNMKESWQTERMKILEETMLREEQLAKAQEEVSSLKTSLARQRDALKAELDMSWSMERERLVKELEVRQSSLAELSKQLEATRESLVAAQTGAQATFEAMRAKLTAEFQELLKSRELEETARVNAWKKEKDRLIADFEDEYQRKKDILLAACEEYRRELEVRERSINEREDGNEQGK